MASTNAYYSDLAVPRSGSPTPWGSPHPLPTRRHPPPKVPLWPGPVWLSMDNGRLEQDWPARGRTYRGATRGEMPPPCSTPIVPRLPVAARMA